MPRKKNWEEIEETPPTALIIGDNPLVQVLAFRLGESGCLIKKAQTSASLSGKFPYIFQFDHFSQAEEVRQKHLLPGGKFLFLETEEEENLSVTEGMRIIRLGDLLLWSPQEAADLILKTMFSSRAPRLTDVRKKSAFMAKKKGIPTTPGVSFSPSPENIKREIKKETGKIKEKYSEKSSYIVRKKKRLIFWLLPLLLIFLGFVGALSFYLYSLKLVFSRFQSHFADGNWQEVSFDLAQAKEKINQGEKGYQLFCQVFFPLKNLSLVKEVGEILDSSQKILVTSGEIALFSQETLNRNKGFNTAPPGLSKQEWQFYGDKLQFLASNMIEAKNQLEGMPSFLAPKEDLLVFLSATLEKINAGLELLPLAEKILFSDSPKVYLLLFQNNMELRPTGGFIGSFGLLTVNQGKILDFKIEDVYTADGQLKGHVDPPLPIKKVLNQPHFFLRDSNFDPDFAISAPRAAWFLEKEIGKKVDGVIGINLFTIQKLLRVLGSVRLNDFGEEEITADNFFFKAQFFVQENFFPGSTQKKDFLTAVANSLFNKLSEKNQLVSLSLFPVIKQALEEKDIIFYDTKEEMQKTLEEAGVGGRLSQVLCVENKEQTVRSETNTCFPDYLAIIEANLGVNKANYFVKKSVTLEKKITGERQVVSLVTLAYENSSLTEIFPAATYVNYLRLLVPLGSKLISLTFNNFSLPASEVTVENYGLDKTSFGFLVKIPPGTSGIVRVTYVLSSPLPVPPSAYQFFYQKQAGDKVSPLVLSLTPSEKLIFTPLNFKSTSSRKEEIFYTTDTSVDRIFVFNLSANN